MSNPVKHNLSKKTQTQALATCSRPNGLETVTQTLEQGLITVVCSQVSLPVHKHTNNIIHTHNINSNYLLAIITSKQSLTISSYLLGFVVGISIFIVLVIILHTTQLTVQQCLYDTKQPNALLTEYCPDLIRQQLLKQFLTSSPSS
jgi:hypothetical protein